MTARLRILFAFLLPLALVACGDDTNTNEDFSDTGGDRGGAEDSSGGTGQDTRPWEPGPPADVDPVTPDPSECDEAVSPVVGCRLTDGESSALTNFLVVDIGDKLSCSGMHSIPVGGIEFFEWSLRSRPEASTLSTILGAGPASGIDFEPDVPGKYIVGLRAKARDGGFSCDTATVEINVEAIPSTVPSMTVSLGWGNSEHDTLGYSLDLDLHLLYNGAVLGSTGDCSATNPSPVWVEPGSPMNPTHGGDNTDLPGGEVVTLAAVQYNVAYQVYVAAGNFPPPEDGKPHITEIDALVDVWVGREQIFTTTLTLREGDAEYVVRFAVDEEGQFLDPDNIPEEPEEPSYGEGSGEGSGED